MRFGGLRLGTALLLLVLLQITTAAPINMELPDLKRMELSFPPESYSVKSKELFKYQFE